MRRFKLIKGTTEYNLTSFNHFLNAPEGFGFDMEFEVLRSGESFVQTSSHQAQKSISGEIVFSGYDQYSEFIDFIGDNENITLGYMPEEEWNFIPVKVASLSKGELDTTKHLICQVELIAFGTWYKVKSFTGANNYIVNNESKFPAPYRLKMTATRDVSYMYWANQTPDGSVIYATGSIADAVRPIRAGQTLIVSSCPEDMQIALYDSSNVMIRNMYQNSDFTKTRFFNLPVGTSKFVCDEIFTLEVIEYAYSV